MPRFDIKKYDPREDSSADYIQLAGKAKCVVLASVTRDGTQQAETGNRHGQLGCPCGCGGMPVGGKAVFLMGHDARLRGKLIRAHLTGTKVIRVLDGEEQLPVEAKAIAQLYGESFTDALVAAEGRRDAANRNVLQRALDSQRLIRVGRWEYTGNVVAIYEAAGGQPDLVEVEYVTSGGKTKKVKVALTDTEEATT
jgi:hypothetical protein